MVKPFLEMVNLSLIERRSRIVMLLWGSKVKLLWGTSSPGSKRNAYGFSWSWIGSLRRKWIVVSILRGVGEDTVFGSVVVVVAVVAIVVVNVLPMLT